MPSRNNPQKNIQRNPFVALCEYASNNNWCWKISCTTCGHCDFRASFSKIVHGQHPDDESFWPHGKRVGGPIKEIDIYNDFFRERENFNDESQMKLASVVAEAKLSDIQAVAKFPDWLGYIGLVMYHCPSLEPRRIISRAFLPQFIAMLKNDREACKSLEDNELIGIGTLEWIESRMNLSDQ